MNAKELATQVAYVMNSFSFGYKDFCEEMGREHRTLQQSFTRLCIYWLRYCAEMKNYDGRNEMSVRVGKIVAKALDDADIHNIPMI